MPIRELTVEGYRSIRKLRLPLGRINVLVGPNGCGKSNLYQSMVLLSAAASGRLARTLADEGGMPSVLWAGPRTYAGDPRRITLGVRLDQFEYSLSAGLPIPDSTHSDADVFTGGSGQNPIPTAFRYDPLIREEKLVLHTTTRRRVTMMHRKGSSTSLRNAEAQQVLFPLTISSAESALSQIREPAAFPELAVLREEISGWRFYHQFRTDPDSPLRHPQVGVRTPVLAPDGRDLAAALQTVLESGDGRALQESIQSALPGSTLMLQTPDSRFVVRLRTEGLDRPLEARELSDGTLRYLCLLAALLSPRPPEVLALNEPETSLHPDLIDPLATLIVRASKESQLWITTHSQTLAQAVERLSGQKPIRLEKVRGETRVAGQGLLDEEEDEE